MHDLLVTEYVYNVVLVNKIKCSLPPLCLDLFDDLGICNSE